MSRRASYIAPARTQQRTPPPAVDSLLSDVTAVAETGLVFHCLAAGVVFYYAEACLLSRYVATAGFLSSMSQYEQCRTSLRYGMHVGLMLLGRCKYTKLSHYYLSLVLFRLNLLLKSWKDMNDQVLIKFRQNWFKNNVKHYILGFINSFNVLEISTNCISSGRSILLHQFKRKVIKLTALIFEVYHYYQLSQIRLEGIY
jgi:hypothetical protein